MSLATHINHFKFQEIVQAINQLPSTPLTLAQFFKEKALKKTTASIEYKDGKVSLIDTQPRGSQGQTFDGATRAMLEVQCLHLLAYRALFADDIQDTRAFGKTEAQTAAEAVNDVLAELKDTLDYSREYYRFCALLGKLYRADGQTVAYDIYKAFGLTRAQDTWQSSASELGDQIDKTLRALKANLRGEINQGWACIVGDEFLEKLAYHQSVKAVYLAQAGNKQYSDQDISSDFDFKGIKFINYNHDFGNGIKLKPNQGIIFPIGGKSTLMEFFAPANYMETVNTVALPYYAKKFAMELDKGLNFEGQSNPLAMVCRPNLVRDIFIE